MVNGFNCSRFLNAPDIDGHIHGGVTQSYLSGIRANGELAYPKPAEAIALAQRYWDAFAQAETERKRQLFGVGSTSAWS